MLFANISRNRKLILSVTSIVIIFLLFFFFVQNRSKRYEQVPEQPVPKQYDKTKIPTEYRKMQSQLWGILDDYKNNKDYLKTAKNENIDIVNGKIISLELYLTIEPQEAINTLKDFGMEIIAVNDNFKIVSGNVPIASLLDIAKLDFVKTIMHSKGYTN